MDIACLKIQGSFLGSVRIALGCISGDGIWKGTNRLEIFDLRKLLVDWRRS